MSSSDKAAKPDLEARVRLLEAIVIEAQASGQLSLLACEALMATVCASQSPPEAFLRDTGEHLQMRIMPLLERPDTAFVARRMLALLDAFLAHVGRIFKRAFD